MNGEHLRSGAIAQLAMLGPPEVAVGEETRPIAGQRRQALLALLVVRRHHVSSAEELCDSIWPNSRPEAGLRSLRSEVHRLRDLLAGCATIETRPGGYRFIARPDGLDLEVFEAHAAMAIATDTAPERARESAERALRLWRGRPFGDLVDLPAVAMEQERLTELRLATREALTDARLALGHLPGELVGELLVLTSEWPARERLWAQLMTALWRDGRQAEALAAYQRARQALVERFGLEPSPRLRAVEAAILAGEGPPYLEQPLDERRQRPTHPGKQTHEVVDLGSDLVGRAEVLHDLTNAVTRHRLITLTGPGGVGKTRLATEVMRATTAGFGDGTLRVDLSGLPAGAGVELIAQPVATAMGVVSQPGVSIEDGVIDALQRRNCLLVLDNCEHVIDSVVALVGRLDSRSHSVVLATSREPLGLASEHVWPIAPLDPATDGTELFCARARQLDATFTATDADLAAIAQLCGRLDGLPLAIELAASRVRALGPVGLANQLSGPSLLSLGAGRDRSARHHTLGAAIGWSVDLLNPNERAALIALSMFRGAFDVDLAVDLLGEAMPTKAPSYPGVHLPSDAVDLLVSLVDKSLLQRVPSQRVARFQVLETVREFCMKSLNEPEASQHRQYVLRCVTRFVIDQAARCWSAAEANAWAALAENWDNVRFAAETALRSRDVDALGTLCGDLALYGLFSGTSEVSEWARAGVTGAVFDGDGAETAVRAAWAVGAYWFRADLDETMQAVASGQLTPARPAAGPYFLTTFMAAQARGDRELSDRVTQKWLARSGEPAWSQAMAATVRAYHGLWMGDDTVDAAALCASALRLANNVASPSLTAYVLVAQAQIVGENDSAAAIGVCDRAVAEVDKLPQRGWLRVAPLAYRSAAAVRIGEPAIALPAARALLEVSQHHAFGQGARFGLWAAAICLARAGQESLAVQLARSAGTHVGRSSLGLTAELDRLLGEAWRAPHHASDAALTGNLWHSVETAIAALDAVGPQ